MTQSTNETLDSPEYSDHKAQLFKSQPDGARIHALEGALLAAFGGVVQYRSVAYICFGDLNAKELADAFCKYPVIIKATLSCVNVAQRAIARDLGITFDTYAEKISPENASLLAGYIKPMLPPAIALPALMELDRYSWADKELRASKGGWEKKILKELCRATALPFLKRKFEVPASISDKTEAFELDAAYENAGSIEIGVDVKRIESPRDIHKRADEIINKASKFKGIYPGGKFVVVVYYPFPNQHINVLSRLESKDIDGVFFAGESDSSIESAVEMLAGKLAAKKKQLTTKASLLSAKRGKSERAGIHAWHPYYAGYSESFVESALSFLECTSQTLVLDPWCGSGTTNIVAARVGVPSIGMDINPAMATFAAAKSPETLNHAESIKAFFNEINLGKRSAISNEWKEDPLLDLFSADTTSLIRSVLDSIPFSPSVESVTGAENHDLSDLVINTKIDASRLINPPYAFAISVLFSTLRKELMPGKSSNPTWSKFSIERHHIESERLNVLLKNSAVEMLNQLVDFYADSNCKNPYPIACGDCRVLPFASESIDRIITSPPYLTRIDYAISTQLEISLLTDKETLAFVRQNTMGAPVITKAKKVQDRLWGKICNDILDKIKAHDTKAAGTYYWKNIVQYFSDAHLALKELQRILRPGGKGVIVVQGSYFKEIEIPLGDIYVEMAQAIGLNASIAYREEVKGHMAHVNTKSSVYKTGKVYFEDFVQISKQTI